MSKRTIAFVWLLVAISGFGGFAWLYFSRLSATHEEYINAYETQWQEARGDALAVAAPDLAEEVAKAEGWRRPALRRLFKKLDDKYRAAYEKALAGKIDGQTSDFRRDWITALKDFSDSPPVEKAVAAVHEKHQPALRKKLTEIDTVMKKRYPRTRLALDSFPGYCIFRSRGFKNRLIAQGIRLHLVDDKAVYKDRIKTLEDTNPERGTPLAVFTADALILNSADSLPASVVMVIDESRGADAIVGDRRTLPNLASMNKKDVKIVLQPDSPSHTLARVVCSKNLPDVNENAFEFVDDDPADQKDAKSAQEKILERFRTALHDAAGKPTAFVLWQPYVSMALAADPNAHILVDSSHCPGSIVDVLVVQKAYLKKGAANREQVKKIIRAYLETLFEHQKDMARLLREDDKNLTEVQAKEVARGIRWKNTAENFAQFGLQHDRVPVESVEQTLTRISKFLLLAGAISKEPEAKALFDATILQQAREGWTGPKEVVRGLPPPTVRREDCDEVPDKKFEPVEFQTGSDEVPELAHLDLRDLAEELKKSPAFYLEIRGQAIGKTESDRVLSRKRALSISKWLQKEGVARERLFTAVDTESVNPQSAVSFLLLKKKAGKSGP